MRWKSLLVLAAVSLLTLQTLGTTLAATNAAPGPAVNVVLTLIPPKLPADGGVYPAAVVSLVDASQNPTAAINPITVFLTSSQPNIASVPNSVIIGAGSEYAIANITTTSTPGAALITAHAEGYGAPSDVGLSTSTPSGFPSRLVVFTAPAEFLPGNSMGTMRVEVVDAAGLPSKAITSIPVSVTSSNVSVASPDQSQLTIPAGTIFASGTFHTSGSGVAVVAATATGYTTGTASVTVDKACASACGAFKLAMTLVPRVLPADGRSYNSLEVSIEAQAGSPAVSSSDTIVQLTSDAPQVASVNNLVSIPAGKIAVLTNITTSALASSANITASAVGLVPASVTIQTIIPAPSKLQAYVAPPSSAYSPQNPPILVIQLQDSNGNPARARNTTNLVVTSSNGSLIASFVSLTIPKGNDYVFSYLHTVGVGQSVLKVSSQGLVSSQVNLDSKPSPLAVSMALSSGQGGFIYSNQTGVVTFSLNYVGQPLPNVNVTWSTTGGATLTHYTTLTDAAGSTSTLFMPPSYGKYNVTAQASTPQTGVIAKTVSILVAEAPTKPAPTLLEQLLGYWYYMAAAAAIAVVAVVYLLRMRRKKQRAEIEAGFEVV